MRIHENTPTGQRGPEVAGPDADLAAEDGPRESDASLLRRYVEGSDDAAFTALVDRHLALVYSAAWRQTGGDRHRAEDITQAVFTALARQASRLVSHPALAGWLLTTTRRIAATILRDERRRERRELESALIPSPDTTPEAAPDEPGWPAIESVLDDALHELNEPDRSAVVLRFFQSRPFAEIGDALGLTANAARMRVDRALHRLRDRLARRGIDSSAAALAATMAIHAVRAAPAGWSAGVAGAALAGAATATLPTASPLLPVMLSLKTKLLAGGLAAALVALPLGWQQQQLAQLRRELANAATDRQSLIEEAATARHAAELATAEAGRLREAQTELLRLRGEIGPLREQLRALTRSTPAPQAARPAKAPGTRPPASEPAARKLADRGAATAEHAAQSLLWAVSSGRLDRLAELLELPRSVPPSEAPRHFQFFAQQLGQAFQGRDFDGWKVDLQGTTNADVVRLDYGYRDLETDRSETFAFFLHRHDSGWKVMVEGEVPEGF